MKHIPFIWLCLLGLFAFGKVINSASPIVGKPIKADTLILDKSKIHVWMGVDMPPSYMFRWKKTQDSFAIHGLVFYVLNDTAWKSPNMPK